MVETDGAASARPVITLWESAGSQMDEIGQRLAEILGLPLHGQAVSSADIARAFDGDDSEDDQFIRLLQSFGSDSVVQNVLSQTDLASLHDRIAANDRAVQRWAREGGVLLGRNGAYILRDWPSALHVRLDGPEHARVNRAAEALDSTSEMVAVQLRFADELRVSMSVFSYGYDPRDLDYYDLVVNTCRLDVEGAAQLIAAVVRARSANSAPDKLA